MKTEELIKAISADARNASSPMQTGWQIALAVSLVVAAAVFFASLGPRGDFVAAAQTGRFLFKFVFTIALAATALAAIGPLSRPGAPASRMAWLLAAPALMLGALLVELAVVPPSLWATRMVGSNVGLCLTFIPLIGIGPLAIFLAALRHGAPTRPALAGAVAGVLAGGVAATFYAAHCFDDSPLFVATWYSLAIAGLACLGALAAPYVARW